MLKPATKRIFISYARKDATRLATELQRNLGRDHDVWLDTKRLEGGASWTAEITAFWDRHFPIISSVWSGYEYHAVCVDRHHFGQVVQGFEPGFEETTLVAASFDEFLTSLLDPKKPA